MESVSLARLFQTFAQGLRLKPQDEPALDAALTSLLAAARTAWPEVALDDATFLGHLARHLSSDEDALTALRELHGSDLYLACACGRGNPAAVAVFEKRFIACVPDYLGRRKYPQPFLEEVQQVLRATLLVGDGERPEPISGYAGRGPLGGWLRMAAVRAALRVEAAQGDGRTRSSPFEPQPTAPETREPELEFLRTHHAEDFRDAVEATLVALSVREANILRMHFLEGLTHPEIARLYRVHERTVRRWLEDTRDKVLAETKRRLVESGRFSSAQLTGLVNLLRNDFDGTLVRLLNRPQP
jgi:RNA polymerase sigma-70 factor (ECF subfamily)